MKILTLIIFTLIIQFPLHSEVLKLKLSISDSTLIDFDNQSLFQLYSKTESYDSQVVSKYLFDLLTKTSHDFVEQSEFIREQIDNFNKNTKNKVVSKKIINTYTEKIQRIHNDSIDTLVFPKEKIDQVFDLCLTYECYRTVNMAIESWLDQTTVLVHTIFYDFRKKTIQTNYEKHQIDVKRYIRYINSKIENLPVQTPERIDKESFNFHLKKIVNNCFKKSNDFDKYENNRKKESCITDYEYFLSKERCYKEAELIDDFFIKSNSMLQCLKRNNSKNKFD